MKNLFDLEEPLTKEEQENIAERECVMIEAWFTRHRSEKLTAKKIWEGLLVAHGECWEMEQVTERLHRLVLSGYLEKEGRKYAVKKYPKPKKKSHP